MLHAGKAVCMKDRNKSICEAEGDYEAVGPLGIDQRT